METGCASTIAHYSWRPPLIEITPSLANLHSCSKSAIVIIKLYIDREYLVRQVAGNSCDDVLWWTYPNMNRVDQPMWLYHDLWLMIKTTWYSLNLKGAKLLVMIVLALLMKKTRQWHGMIELCHLKHVQWPTKYCSTYTKKTPLSIEPDWVQRICHAVFNFCTHYTSSTQ